MCERRECIKERGRECIRERENDRERVSKRERERENILRENFEKPETISRLLTYASYDIFFLEYSIFEYYISTCAVAYCAP